MRSIVVDAGAVVGLLDATDRHHARAAEFFAELRPNDRLITTWPVITECFYLLERSQAAMHEWLAGQGIEVIDFGLDDLPAMRRWSEGYRDREVDFADATLVWLAGRERTALIATTDFNDFEAYRLPRGKRFRNLLQRP